jgi:hypothetical protein
MLRGGTVGGLVGRAERAGAVGVEAFADWLIIDEQWFGPVRTMDRRTYSVWRRRAVRIYTTNTDVDLQRARVLASIEPLTPLTGPSDSVDRPVTASRKPDRDTRTVRAVFTMTLIVFLVLALCAAAGAVAGTA